MAFLLTKRHFRHNGCGAKARPAYGFDAAWLSPATKFPRLTRRLDGEFSRHSAFCGQASWRIPVVIDAAAAFDATVPGDVPSVVSLHATKALGSGEGGYVASRDAALVTRVKAYLAFGFQNGREATVPGFNGKMSEYAACVGLASLDGRDEARAAFELPHAKVRSFGFAFQPTRYIVKQ